MKFLLFLVFFYLIFTQPSLAQDYGLDGSTQNLGDGYSRGWCMKSQEYLVNDSIYLCKSVVAVAVPPDANRLGRSRQQYIQGSCWSWAFSSPNSVYSNVPANAGVLVAQTYSSYEVLPTSFDYSVPCKLKTKADPDEAQVCAQPIDVRRLVNGAFSNKFPLDLFNNFVSSGPVTACPSFTIREQTFQLCYLNKLVASLKYVLLIVFIISSVVAL